MIRPTVTWFTTREPLADVERDRLTHAFKKHLRADFMISREGSAFGEGAVRIDGDIHNKLSIVGCLELIRDTLEA